MQNQLDKIRQLSKGSWGLALIALGIVLVVGMTPQLVNAQSKTETTFNSPLPGGEGPGHHGPGSGENPHDLLDGIIDRDAILADVLGITEEELQAAREDGARLDELIDQLGLDPQTVRQELDAAKADAVQQAVEDGLLTEEEAAAILNPPTRGPQGDPNSAPEEDTERPNRGPRDNRPAPPSDASPADESADTSTDAPANSASSSSGDQNRGMPPSNDANGSNSRAAENGSANGQSNSDGNRAANARSGRR